MKNGVLKLGFAPTRRVLTTPKAFNKDEARRIKDCIEAEIRMYPMLELVTLDTKDFCSMSQMQKKQRHFSCVSRLMRSLFRTATSAARRLWQSWRGPSESRCSSGAPETLPRMQTATG